MNQKNKIILIIVVTALLGIGAFFFLNKNSGQSISTAQPVSTTTNQNTNTKNGNTATTSNANLKTYRNEEWGFEFEYKHGWSFHENTFYNPSSKLNLIGAAPEENNNPNPIRPSVLINIVTENFAEKAAAGRERLGATISNISVAGVLATKYEYIENTPKISIDIPNDQYNFIISSPKKYEDILNQILSSFRFLDK